ncbi:MAG: ABC transporter ATP-binding protein/permease [Bacteroidales bacterium]|nr:ABC transporter ATP-binding protein/permease [Bacteroidales bacterium]MCM1416278.1 ABC transporter ATP-binding protein/permease [bacterium]MCM1423475.1 ABC transporter ATP-binding protein/permease [bacterium]
MFGTRQKKKKDDNPLHTEYGILSNSLYILGKIKRYRPALLCFMGIGMVTNSLTQYLWSFIGKFVIDIAQAQAASPEKDTGPLLRLVIVTTLIELFVLFLNTIANNRCWYNMINARMHIISERVAKSLSMNYQMLEQPKILDMHTKACVATNNNTSGVEGLMHSISDFGVQLLLMLATVVAVAVLDPRIILILAVLSVLQYLFFRYTVKKDRKNVWEKLAPTWRKIEYMTQLTQDFSYAKDIRLFAMKRWLVGKHHDILLEKQEKMLYSRNLWIYNSIFAHGISMLTQACVYGVLIYSVIDKNMSIGNFTLYLGLSMTFSSALGEFLNTMGTFKERSMQVDDFRSFMNLETDDETDCIPVPKADRYTFVFQDVSFRYEGAEDYAIKHLTLTLEAGKKLAVVGLNGAGKTTFIKLLLRLYDVTEGAILLNGTDIRKFRREEYYRLFSPVFQNVELFAFPIAENVSMKRPDDTDKAFAKACLVKAGMQEKLDSLSEGIDTQLLKVLHDDGVDLSGGEKQKLALARALYKNAPVLVLDEPTAALDALAEYELYRNFNEIIGDRSAVYISHRLSSTRFCDSIAMFQAGEMVEYGTHDELLQAGGAYAEMFEIQAQYYKDEEVRSVG